MDGLETGLLIPADLEIRQEGSRRLLRGRFPYGGVAVVNDRGTDRKETIMSGAFHWAIENRTDRVGNQIRIDLLVGHDWGKPLASRQAGTLAVREVGDGVEFEAMLPDDPPSWVIDAEKAVAGGLARGLSPGFRPVPPNIDRNAVTYAPEPGNPAVQVRQVNTAVLRELSVVTSGAYHDAFVEMRAEDFGTEPATGPYRRIHRWL